MRKRFFFEKGLAIIIFIFAFVVGLSYAVMAIWNNVLVDVLHVGAIGFWQALGIFGLAKILFGGFPGGGRWGRGGAQRWKSGMKEKWESMTPDQKEKFKSEWSNRCARFPKRPEEKNPADQ